MKTRFTKRTLACLIGGMMFGMTADALAATATSTATVAVTGHAPVLTAGDITFTDNNGNGALDIGDTVLIDAGHDFAFTDADGDTETTRTYNWKADGVDTGETGATYTITAADLGKTITLEVTPHTDASITEPADGVAVTATHDGGKTGGLPVAGGDDVVSVAISGGTGTNGAPIVNDTLTATPACASGNACPAGITYKWQVEDAVGSGTYTDIAGATNSTWTVTKTTQKRKIQVVVENPAP